MGDSMIELGTGLPPVADHLAGEGRTPEQVVADALGGELRLSLSLAGVLAHSSDPVSEADTVIDNLGAVAVDALVAAGFSVQK